MFFVFPISFAAHPAAQNDCLFDFPLLSIFAEMTLHLLSLISSAVAVTSSCRQTHGFLTDV
jgi:hypothetical protein